MTDTQPCMGGFCHLREKCAHHQTQDRTDPAERLCEPGHERAMFFVVVEPPTELPCARAEEEAA